jgi:sialic acid synthase SpsE
MFIAEIGSNYNNDLELAKKYIKAAQNCGANAVKFQTLRKNLLVTPKSYVDGKAKPNPFYESFLNLELADEWHFILKEIADECRVEFISTPFFLEAVELLDKVGVQTYKVASGDITFFPLLEAIGHTGKRVLLSTGASWLQDIEKALNVLTRAGAGAITLLHCVSSYPPHFDEMNLKAIVTMREAFDLPVGISDHSPGILVPIAAVALGASVIEKHVTFNKSLPGPDHSYAMTMEEFKDMVDQIRTVEQALGTGKKTPTASELQRQFRIRRGVYDLRS